MIAPKGEGCLSLCVKYRGCWEIMQLCFEEVSYGATTLRLPMIPVTGAVRGVVSVTVWLLVTGGV